jgi:replication fork protection complex subunit Tof1/Swi1
LHAVELLVQLTWQIEHDPSRAEDALQISYEAPLKAAQIGYKNAILHHPEFNILRPIIRIALPSMAIPRRDRPERDDHIISLSICLLRNLVEISARNSQAAGIDRDKNEFSRSEMILSFERSDVFNLLAALAAGATDEFEKIDCLLLEVLFHLLKGVNPEEACITAVESRSVNLPSFRPLIFQKPFVDLSNMLRKEESIKRQQKRNGSTRHNRFGTMISVVKDNDLRLTVPGQAALLNGQAQTLEKLDLAKKYHKPPRPADAVITPD